MPNRVVMRIELTPKAKDTLISLSKDKGMTQVAVASRLVDWFAHQPDAVQAMILGQYPAELTTDVVRLILRHLEEQEQG